MSISGSGSTTKARASGIGHRPSAATTRCPLPVARCLLPALCVLLAACPPKAPTVTPAGAFRPSSRAELAEAEARSAPARREIVRFGWRSDDGSLQLSGNGAARVAPPDSLRVDMAASLGLGRATVIMAGQRVEAQPQAVVDRILPDRFALWALLGYMKLPAAASTVEKMEDGDRIVWRITDERGRITLFEMRGNVLIGATREDQGRTTSALQLTRDASGILSRAQLTDFGRSLRIDIEITGREASEAFAADTWSLRP